MKLSNRNLLDIPVISLLAANTMPLFGVLFVYNYLLKEEYKTAKSQQLMYAPYGRVVVMLLSILFGVFLAMALGSQAA